MPPFIDGTAVRKALVSGARDRQPGVRKAPAERGAAPTVVHVAVHAVCLGPNVGGGDRLGEELGDVFVGGPVARHAQLVPVLVAELLLQVRVGEPVIAEPIQVRELLVGKLELLSLKVLSELRIHPVVEVERRVRKFASFAVHIIGEVHRALEADVRPDEVGVVDINVVDAPAGRELRLQLLHQVALPDDVVRHVDARDLGKGLGERLRFPGVCLNRLGDRLDIGPTKRFGVLREPHQLVDLLPEGKHRRLKLEGPFHGGPFAVVHGAVLALGILPGFLPRDVGVVGFVREVLRLGGGERLEEKGCDAEGHWDQPGAVRHIGLVRGAHNKATVGSEKRYRERSSVKEQETSPAETVWGTVQALPWPSETIAAARMDTP
jgi:hypothetical protein